jgi:hypothetical protein
MGISQTRLDQIRAVLAHESNREPEDLARNKKNRTLRFGKSDYPVLSISTAVRSATGTRQKGGKNHGNPRGWRGGKYI